MPGNKGLGEYGGQAGEQGLCRSQKGWALDPAF